MFTVFFFPIIREVFYALDTYQNPPRSCSIKVFEPIVQKSEIARWIGEEFQKEAISDRYNTAKEMKNALSQKNFASDNHQQQYSSSAFITQSHSSQKDPQREPSLSLWKTVVYALSVLYIISIGVVVLYDWKLSQRLLRRKTTEPALTVGQNTLQLPVTASPPAATMPALSEKPIDRQPSILADRLESIEIPILPIGTTKERLKEVLGQPNAIQKGYWADSTAWIYQDRANGSIDLGYLFDLDTNKLRQTEVAISPSIGVATINDILDSLLRGDITLSISQQLQKIYRREADEYSFRLGVLEGSIQRDADDLIYLGVWEADFH